MTFPVVFHPLGLDLPAHFVFETLAYTLGFQFFLLARRRAPHESVPFEQMAWILVGAVFGALVGSKLLAWIEHPAHYLTHLDDPAAWIGGKTVVGGLLGGWIGVELAKRAMRIRTRTGDLYALPLCLAIAVGRVGCFLSGLPDMTYGTPTALPWGIDFGDGVRRHPTQLYEILACGAITGLLILARRWTAPRVGARFRLMLGCYLLWRFAVEWIKPSPKGYLGLSAIQIASLVGACACAWQLIRIKPDRAEREPSPAPSSGSAFPSPSAPSA